MMEDKRTISIEILDKPYQVKCDASEIAALQESALHLNKKMREIRNKSMLRHSETIAIMAALNICHDHLQLQQKQEQYVLTMTKRVQQLQSRIDETLEKQNEIEF